MAYGGEHKGRASRVSSSFSGWSSRAAPHSLRDIEACLRAQNYKLYHMGIRSLISRSTLADANEARDWRIHAAFAQRLITMARTLFLDEPFGMDLKARVYAFDATTVDLCLSVFPWAPFRTRKDAEKQRSLLDLSGNISVFIHICDGKMHEVNILDRSLPEAGVLYVMDRGYLDFERLIRLNIAGSFFMTRGKSNLKAKRRESRQVELFFEWIKLHLRIKQFYGTIDYAVKMQIWTSVSTYVLVAIDKKRLKIHASLSEILQILSLTIFEQAPLDTPFSRICAGQNDSDAPNQTNFVHQPPDTTEAIS